MRSMFSVIIPTYNRSGSLRRTLDGYLNQTVVDLINEIIVIDDGSNEKHARDNKEIIEKHSQDSPFDIKYLWQDNKGPASARNNGIKNASGEYILLTGDDIVPNPDMIKEHFLKHKSYNLDKNIAVLGHTVWPDNIKVTPFMKHIQDNGLQFGYSIIPDEDNVPFSFFYTSNVSLHRDFLLESKLFDSDFKFAAWEDIELAYRLMKRGMRLVFNKNARGYHCHNVSFASFRKRQELCGVSAHIFYSKHNELGEFLGMNNTLHQSIPFIILIKLAEAFCLFTEKKLPWGFPVIYNQVMDYYYKKGLKKAMGKGLPPESCARVN